MNKVAGVNRKIPASKVKATQRKSAESSETGISRRENTKMFTNIDHRATLANLIAEIVATSLMTFTDETVSDTVIDEMNLLMILLLLIPAWSSGELVSKNCVL
jgi:hypothetical protein